MALQKQQGGMNVLGGPLQVEGVNVKGNVLTSVVKDDRMFGEKGLPSDQGWTEFKTGSTDFYVEDQTIDGISRQVIKFDDDYGDGRCNAYKSLSLADWINIATYGATFKGRIRLDSSDGQSGFYTGLQADNEENPLANGDRRYGLLFTKESGGDKLFVESPDSGDPLSIAIDNTTWDEWFEYEIVVPQDLGNADIYINKVLVGSSIFTPNNGGKGTHAVIGSGSTNGTNRVFYVDNFGVIINEESHIINVNSADINSYDELHIIIPSTHRDFNINFQNDITGRPVGATIKLTLLNVGGVINIDAGTELTFNGLAAATQPVNAEVSYSITNITDNANTYVSETPKMAIKVYTNRPALEQLSRGQTFFLDDPIDGLTYFCAFDGTDVIAVEASSLYTPV